MSVSYAADDLTHLEGLEAVRKRPGMYIGSSDSRGVLHLFVEIVDNATDEAVAGHGRRVEVTLHADGSVTVADEGRGIPAGVNKKTKMSGVKMALTLLHSGGKFSSKSYATSGGLHGVGSAVVNALSLRMDTEVRQNGDVYAMSFRHGRAGVFDGDGPDASFVDGGDLQVMRKMRRGEKTGTSIRYWFDAAYFETGARLDVEKVRDKLRYTAFLVPGVTYVLHDLTGDTPAHDEFCFPGGLTDMVDYLTPSSDRPVCSTVLVRGSGTYVENAADEAGVMQSNVERIMEVEIALRWGTGYESRVECFTNTIHNTHGGTHRKGFERGLNKALSDLVKKTRGLVKPKDELPVLDDMLEGVTAVVHVRVPEPQFTSQTKDELSTAGVLKVTQKLVDDTLRGWGEDRKRKTDVRVVLTKIVQAAQVRHTQKAHKEAARRKTALEGTSMPAKLVDCRTTGVDRSELFIVEGDSALGCFTGDTRVAVVGRPAGLSFVELVTDWGRGIVHHGYATDEVGDVHEVVLQEPRYTKTVTKVVDVSLDNGVTVTCTPDHLFRLRDRHYVRADTLTVGVSLMPLYRKTVPSLSAGFVEQVVHNREPHRWGPVVPISSQAVEQVAGCDDHCVCPDVVYGYSDYVPRCVFNHQVVAVVARQETVDVYDVTVDGFHNFALEAGVFVHNSARKARSGEYQALLPIRGKILNVQKATLKQMLDNAECSAIIQVLGAGSGRSFDGDALRYGRIILMADADVDGSHIRCLLITLFAKYMRPVIEQGRLYSAVPPLHKVTTKGRNPETVYTFTQQEMEMTVARFADQGKQVVTPVPRYKGLGEMDAEELWETTMDPQVRTVRRITVDDVAAAETTLELLMGNEVEARRQFIVENAARVDSIDV